MSVNKCYFTAFVIIVNINSFVAGYIPAYSNQVEYIFEAKFNFDTIDKQD